MVSLKGTNQEFGRPYNRRIVLEAIRLHGPVERAEIARRVGLTVQTVANITHELEAQGFIKGSRSEPRGRGSPATSLAINPSGAHAIGVHVTPRGLEAALVDLAGSIIAREHRALERPGPDQTMTEIGRLAKQFGGKLKGKRMLGIGMAMPGPFDVDSMSFVGPTTLEGWRGFPVLERLNKVSGLPAFIEVDHAAAALGERLHGAGKAFRDFYFLYFGVGLGGCMVHEGLPWRGSHRNAGEIGHLPLVPNGEPCPCGNRGCLERYLSLEAYGRRATAIGREAWIGEAAPLFRNASRQPSRTSSTRKPSSSAASRDSGLLDDLIAAAQPLPNSVSQRARPRGAAADARRQRTGRRAARCRGPGRLPACCRPASACMFAEGDRTERDPIIAGRQVA